MSEKVRGNPENKPQTTKEDKPRRQVNPDTARAIGEKAIKGSK